MGGMTSSSATPDGSEVLDHGVRAGLVAYGLVHLVVGWTAVQLALGEQSGKANQTGALQELASSTLGATTLWALALGFAALVVWQLTELVTGHRDEDGAKLWFKRASNLGKAAVYGTLAASSVRLASPGSGRSQGTDTLTARLMSAPGGQVLVGLVGLGVIAVGGWLAYKGLTQRFTRELDVRASSGDRRPPVVLLGTVGYVAKGVVLGVIGVLFVVAAVQHEPKESGGLDQALHAVLEQPFGRPLLFVVALGLAAFGLFCFLWARHLDRD